LVKETDLTSLDIEEITTLVVDGNIASHLRIFCLLMNTKVLNLEFEFWWADGASALLTILGSPEAELYH
jgi:hypothetical protein